MSNEDRSRKLTQDEFTRIYLAAEMAAQLKGGAAADHFLWACMKYMAFVRMSQGVEYWHLNSNEEDPDPCCKRFAYRLDSEGNLERIVSSVRRADWSEQQKR